MTVLVTGVLPDPMGQPLDKATIRVTTIHSEFTPPGSEAEQVTGKDGAYSFSLEEGIYRIDLNQDEEFTEGKEVTIDASLTGSIELPALLANYGI